MCVCVISSGDLLGDTHGVLALTDQRLSVVLSLWSHCDQLKCVWSGAKLSVCWFHLLAGAVSQVDAAHGMLTEEEHEETKQESTQTPQSTHSRAVRPEINICF